MKFYFTFGSDPCFPWGRKDYVVVDGKDRSDAVSKYNRKYPPRHDNLVNCAFIYPWAEFRGIKSKYYRNVGPADVIR